MNTTGRSRYSRYTKASQYAHLYKTALWRKISKTFIAAHPCCTFCGAPTKVADHKIPHKGSQALFFDLNNLIGLCISCHNSDKAKLENGKIDGKDFVINNKSDDSGLPLSVSHPWNKED